jgi:hypothetical protein
MAFLSAKRSLSPPRRIVTASPFCPSNLEFPFRQVGGPIRRGGLESFLKINDAAESVHKVSEAARRQHNRITPPADVLSDFKETPTLVFFQIEKENLTIHLNFL